MQVPLGLPAVNNSFFSVRAAGGWRGVAGATDGRSTGRWPAQL